MDRYIRLFTSSSKRAGSPPNGNPPRTTGEPSSIVLRDPGVASLKLRQPTGSGSQQRSHTSCKSKRLETNAAATPALRRSAEGSQKPAGIFGLSQQAPSLDLHGSAQAPLTVRARAGRA